MPHPKKRKTKSGRNQRRSHHSLVPAKLASCDKCGKPVKPHFACSACGYYNKREVIDVLKKLSGKEKSKIIKEKKAKEIAEKKEKTSNKA